MTTAQDPILTRPWRKSSRSTGGNDCVEVAQSRNKLPGPRLEELRRRSPGFRPQAWAAFIGDIKHGTE